MISVIFSLGAIVGAMITMYGSVANRTIEIGTLRALGFSRFTILNTFLVESVMIAIIGGAIGIMAAYFLKFLEVSTTNWDTFAELAFTFETSPTIIIGAMSFVEGTYGARRRKTLSGRDRTLHVFYQRGGVTRLCMFVRTPVSLVTLYTQCQ